MLPHGINTATDLHHQGLQPTYGFIVSPAYFMFEIIDRDVLNEEYLMMWFRRPEFDRECWFMTDGSVRGGISWDDLCRIQLPVPPYERQLDVVESYRAITRRIAMKKEINDNLAA